eukprot:TRINITY_DN21835_c0_g3_i1.p1 TRINITY_DN21835_c0_g3~~TRINITY_DN21835_c0_g3_i1.p1  ORF type:complete len:699 (-),score=84.90 TRINITY_DN21835_c0_g3_i1:80-2176(-)
MLSGLVFFLSALLVLYIEVQSVRKEADEDEVSGEQPNPPTWPDSVKVFGVENAAEIQDAVDEAYKKNGGHSPGDHGHWSDHRFAFLFKKGNYSVDVPVGYYTQVAGLGLKPSDVTFTSEKGVYCDEGTHKVGIGGLNTFWRSAENFRTEANYSWWDGAPAGMLWAASQAAPMRRLEVKNNLVLFRYRQGEFLADYVSGGYLANSKIEGRVSSGSQQQYYTRNTDIDDCWHQSNWNMVFMGVNGAPMNHCGQNSVINLKNTPVVAEKPFISFDEDSGKYKLNIPQRTTNKRGVDLDPGESVDFSNVYVASDEDSAEKINAQLDGGNHIVLTPGIYRLTEPIVIKKEGTVLLGLGLATLISSNGNACIEVENVAGVRIGGILVAAGPSHTETLVRIGSSKWAGDASNPVMLQDLFIRVGDHSASGVQADTMLTINTGHTIGDDMWLWRADHTAEGLVRNGDNPSHFGMIVNADDVTMLGISAEHSLHDQVQWNGDRGATYFLQVELPYDWSKADAEAGHTGYRVADNVQSHIAYGIGIYHFFRDHAITINTGVIAPSHLEDQFIQPFGVFLNGKGVMTHLINGKGDKTSVNPKAPEGANPKWFCDNQVPESESGPVCGGSPPRSENQAPSSPPPPPAELAQPAPAPVAPSGDGTCKVGENVACSSGGRCQGNQCCSDLSICPSAEPSFAGCAHPKKTNCL